MRIDMATEEQKTWGQEIMEARGREDARKGLGAQLDDPDYLRAYARWKESHQQPQRDINAAIPRSKS